MSSLTTQDIQKFYTELTTGLRRGEICGLKWEDFDEQIGSLKIRRTVTVQKGGGLGTGETKTETGTRTIILPPSTAELLKARKNISYGELIFPNFYEPEKPIAPYRAYGRLKTLLKQVGLPSVRFHDLRHTFATMALEYGMDVKTLSAAIGHMSAKTTLNVYSHMTDTMREQAAVKIDRSIGGSNARIPSKENNQAKTEKPLFEPYKPKIRRAGTGCISRLNEHLYEGRYSPRVDGRRISRNVYAKTREECEEKLSELIKQMKKELKK